MAQYIEVLGPVTLATARNRKNRFYTVKRRYDKKIVGTALGEFYTSAGLKLK